MATAAAVVAPEASTCIYFHRGGIPNALEAITLKEIDYLEFSY